MPRTTITSEQYQTLKEAYEAGMNSTKKKELIEDVAAKLHLTSELVKVWIGNYRRKLNGNGAGLSTEKKKAKVYAHYTGYHQYCNEMYALKGNKDFKEWGETWRRLPAVEKIAFKNKAKAKMCEKISDKGEEEKKTLREKLMKNLHQMCTQLQETGMEIAAIAGSPGGNSCLLGSQKGLEFLFKEDAATKFESFLKAGIPVPITPTEDKASIKIQLRAEVTNLFNTTYSEAVHKKTKFPYKAYKRGTRQIFISGLPEGVEFKNPNNMGVPSLRKILENAGNLKMHLGEELTQEQHDVNNVLTSLVNEETELRELPQAVQENASESSVPIAPDLEQLLRQVGAHNRIQDDKVIKDTPIKRRKRTTVETQVKRNKKQAKKRKPVRHEPDSELYIVEKIMEERLRGDGSKEYLIKWEGYGDGDNTWEPANNIPSQSITEYENVSI